MALLAMGVGFRPTYTGRENIEYGGLLLGMMPSEIRDRTEVIVEFSELGDSIDQPYFTYSSGMRARLAFSLATHIATEIVILDETLATGDQRFAAKCYRRLHQVRDSGVTILFVSHNLGEVARLTSRVLVLEEGSLRFDGDVFTGLEFYEQLLLVNMEESGSAVTGLASVDIDLKLLNKQGQPLRLVRPGQSIDIEFNISAARDLGCMFVFLRMINVENNNLTSYLMVNRWNDLVTGQFDGNSNVDLTAGRTTINWSILHWVAGEGTYSIDAYIGPPIDASMPDISVGRFWRNAVRLTVAYENHYLKGANSALEMPVEAVTIKHTPTLPATVTET